MTIAARRQRARLKEIMDDLITVSEAARLKGVNESSVRKAIKSGRLAGRKVGPVHLVSRQEVRAWEIIGHRPKRKRRETVVDDTPPASLN